MMDEICVVVIVKTDVWCLMLCFEGVRGTVSRWMATKCIGFLRVLVQYDV